MATSTKIIKDEQNQLHKPFLKWAGGKSQLLRAIQEIIPKDYNSYFEPFVGSGAVYFKLIPVEKTVYINDINTSLINVYQCTKDNVQDLLKSLGRYSKEYKECASVESRRVYYDKKRECFNKLKNGQKNLHIQAALFIFLNKTCFNGMYRENLRGAFNTPFGSGHTNNIFEAKNIEAASERLKGAHISSGEYSNVLKKAQKGDFIYLDPPYHPVSRTSSFTKYHANDFVGTHQEELREVFDELSQKGCMVLMSNSDTEVVRDLYGEYEIMEIDALRTINCKAHKRGRITELLIRNY